MSPITGNPVQSMSPEEQALASYPDVTARRSPSDGLVSTGQPNSTGPAGTALAPLSQQPGDQQPQAPTLATVSDPVLLFKAIDGLVRSQERLASNRWAIDLYARRVRANIPFSYLEKIPNQAIWIAKMPDGVTRERAGQSPNKADDLLNKLEATIGADPMRPDPISHLDSEEAEQAADLAAEYLRSVMGESGINFEELHRWALNVALTCGSAFIHYDIDEQGGGYQPLQILAHPEAQDAANPMVAPTPGPGLPGPDGAPPPPVEMPTPDPVLRFVSAPTAQAPSGQFVTDASQADKVWLPKPIAQRVRREQVRMFPPDADIENARACILILWCTLQEGITKWPDTVGKMSQGDLLGLAQWPPTPGVDKIVPFALRNSADGQSGAGKDEVGSFSPLMQRRMYYYRMYIKSIPEYQDGWQCDISGYSGGTVLGSQTLEYQVKLPKDGTTTRCRDIPVEQIRPTQDVDGGDPMGWAVIHRFAGSSETEQVLYSAYQDAINLRLNPHVFLRSTAAVDDEDWADRSTPIILNPGDAEPNYEQFSQMPDVLSMIENVDRKMDSIAGLGETGQGLETSTSVSGVAKQITVQQAAKDIGNMLHQYNSAKTRGCRILVQIAQAKFPTPQLMQYTGEDGSQQTEWWTGENLAGVDDIGIEPGTGTTMTPEGKAQLAQFGQNLGWLPVAAAAKVGLAGIERDLGLPKDPTMEAIERTVGLWLKGPPDGWMEAYEQSQEQIDQWKQADAMDQQAVAKFQAALQAQATVNAGQAPPTLGPESQNEQVNLQVAAAQLQLLMNPLPTDPMTGAPLPPQPTAGPKPKMPWSPFQPRPNDTEPTVAAKWAERLSTALMSPEYTRHPQPWKDLLNEFYTQERQAVAMIPQGHPSSPMTPSSGGSGGGPKSPTTTTPHVSPAATNGPGKP